MAREPLTLSLRGRVDGIIDSHVHQWDPSTTPRQTSSLAWAYRLNPELSDRVFRAVAPTTLRELLLTGRNVAGPYLPANYADDAAGVISAVGVPVHGVVHVEAGWTGRGPLAAVQETRWLEQLPFGRNGAPELIGIVAHADPRNPLCGDLLDAHLDASTKVRGVRLNAAWHPDPKVKSWFPQPAVLRSREFLAGFSKVAERDLYFDATVYSNQLADVAILAREYPATTVVVSHCATPIGIFGPMGSGTGATLGRRLSIAHCWMDGLADLATLPNVMVKLSGFAFPQLGFGQLPGGNIGGRADLAEIWRPYVDRIVAIFGPDRLLFGSNYPMDKTNATLPDLVGMLADILCNHADATLVQKVFHDNAIRLQGVGSTHSSASKGLDSIGSNRHVESDDGRKAAGRPA